MPSRRRQGEAPRPRRHGERLARRLRDLGDARGVNHQRRLLQTTRRAGRADASVSPHSEPRYQVGVPGALWTLLVDSPPPRARSTIRTRTRPPTTLMQLLPRSKGIAHDDRCGFHDQTLANTTPMSGTELFPSSTDQAARPHQLRSRRPPLPGPRAPGRPDHGTPGATAHALYSATTARWHTRQTRIS